METSQLEALIKKYNRGECSSEEKQWLEDWYLSFEWSKGEDVSLTVLNEFKQQAWNDLQQTRITNGTVPEPVIVKRRFNRRWWYFSVAATVLLVVGAIYFFKGDHQASNQPLVVVNEIQKNTAILPGTSKASLTMADGSVIVLDSAFHTPLKESDGTTIHNQKGTIIYKNSIEKNKKALYNTLNTPRGGEYQLVLPDGSKVWLNASSSLKFPTSFNGNERIVQLEGEAYFEIAQNQAQPFKVAMDQGMEVQVTGTHFNVMAYHDEEYLKTTLTEGRVKVKNGQHAVLLQPNQQAALQKSTQKMEVKKEVDIDKEIAWKNGMIEFQEDNLPYIMRQLSRWYDVEVSFKGVAPKGHYNGSIPRKATLSEVMQILKLAGVKYSLDHKKLIITGA